jgi:hypothetical protein
MPHRPLFVVAIQNGRQSSSKNYFLHHLCHRNTEETAAISKTRSLVFGASFALLQFHLAATTVTE